MSNTELLEQLAALAELQKQATPGPWAVHDNPKLWATTTVRLADTSQLVEEKWRGNRDADAQFVVEARNFDFTALLATLSPTIAAAELPALTCPAIDRAIAAFPDAAPMLEELRLVNSQLRIACWAESERANHFQAHAAARPATPAAAVAAEAGGWIPVGERLPETMESNHHIFRKHYSDLVLAVEDGKVGESLYYCDKKGGWYKVGGGGYEVTGISYWQPLPTAPVE